MNQVHWIALNNRLHQGISLINNLSKKKFELLLTHIIDSTTDEFFTDIELQKLKESLKLGQNELQLLVQSIAHIHKQSSKVILKPTDLQRQLVEFLGLETEKAQFFVKKWSEVTKSDLGDLDDRYNLDNMTWELNLQVEPEVCIPNARIQLDVSKINEDKEENIILELGEDDLQQLYNMLETIQLRLDNVSKK